MADELNLGLDMLRESPRPARRTGLSLDRVVTAAIELADADGLEAVSMSRVAERLGFTPMSLYRHVSGKEELLLRMFDRAAGDPPPLDGDGSWRAALERWSWALLTVVRRHPWVLDLPVARPPWTPAQLAWLDAALAALAGTGLSEDEKAAAALLLNNQVFSQARFDGDVAGAGAELAAYTTQLSALVDGDRFPALRRALDAGIFDGGPDDDADADFAFGLGLALDGIERLVARRA
jgi:AcrR family transcriptional regulator